MKLFPAIVARLISISERRSPDFVIGGATRPYLRRWFLIPRNPVFNIYLHQFLRSDDDRALHDHPWVNLSILLSGRYIEQTPKGRVLRVAGDIVLRGPRARHRVELVRRLNEELTAWLQECEPCWTLFITGPRVRAWGFHCPQGFVPWQDFTAPDDKGEIGKGCDQ